MSTDDQVEDLCTQLPYSELTPGEKRSVLHYAKKVGIGTPAINHIKAIATANPLMTFDQAMTTFLTTKKGEAPQLAESADAEETEPATSEETGAALADTTSKEEAQPTPQPESEMEPEVEEESALAGLSVDCEQLEFVAELPDTIAQTKPWSHWLPVVAQLQAHRGLWAVISRRKARNADDLRRKIIAGDLRTFPKGSFEAQCTRPDEQGMSEIYCRYVGPVGESLV